MMRNYVKYIIMEHRITATDLARRLGDVLGRIRYRGDAFLIERNGEPIARIGPLPGRSVSTLSEALRAWVEAADPDPTFAHDLECVAEQDRVPENPWGS